MRNQHCILGKWVDCKSAVPISEMKSHNLNFSDDEDDEQEPIKDEQNKKAQEFAKIAHINKTIIDEKRLSPQLTHMLTD